LSATRHSPDAPPQRTRLPESPDGDSLTYRWTTAFLRRQTVLFVPSVVGFCVLVWIWRRPEQLSRPYVWDEESWIIEHFTASGWAGALKPVQGYLILPANVLVALATQISGVHLPALEYIFALLVFVGTVVMIVVPESRWGGPSTRAAMAVTASLVPTNPEVFGVLLYSFWWTTLWPLIILGWKRSLWALRAPLLAVAALSSPAAGSLFVVFGIAYLRWRRLRDAIGAGILLAGFVVESVLALNSSRATTISSDASPRKVAEQALRVGGFFETNWLAVGNPDRGFLAFTGLLFLTFLLVACVYLAAVAGRDEVLLLTLAAFAFTAVNSLPVPLISDPVSKGQRYYFLPFVVFGWALLSIVRAANLPPLRIAAAVLLSVSFLNLATTFSRSPQTTTARLSWKGELEKCARSEASVVRVPVYFDGSSSFLWSIDLSPSRCRGLLG
jgi:hypothetical protein